MSPQIVTRALQVSILSLSFMTVPVLSTAHQTIMESGVVAQVYGAGRTLRVVQLNGAIGNTAGQHHTIPRKRAARA